MANSRPLSAVRKSTLMIQTFRQQFTCLSIMFDLVIHNKKGEL